MEIRKGRKKIKRGCSIIDIKCSEKYTIFVFQGALSENDIVIKYTQVRKKIRTPKHIHWVVDMLMKMQGEKELAKSFLLEIRKIWDQARPLCSNDATSLSYLLVSMMETMHFSSFERLNRYGEYDIEFLFILMSLLIIQEKTSREDAYLFQNILDELLEDELDIFSIMSIAGFNGR